MNLNEIKEELKARDHVGFVLPDGKKVPAHFHVTEIGKVDKHFMDCGGKERKEVKASIQLWSSIDIHHRLTPEKLIKIIDLSQKKLGLTDEEVEVEYQGDTVGKYALDSGSGDFQLVPTQTTCLAKEDCGVPKLIVNLADKADACCSTDSMCC
ncbi:DUF6428 family protein [Portibacter marinus]|uniref:DUF6428 family protein n=1 Tax=Portibacter marinus TaxID=2898660 RepID=UPI001F32104E|nr:DUF6428 family protein [Portibacter marinus]